MPEVVVGHPGFLKVDSRLTDCGNDGFWSMKIIVFFRHARGCSRASMFFESGFPPYRLRE